ncbi:uncharacterized protein MELLADRAFT_66143 [Melampsora larici-populina 98AG31]|uniref:Uncharacterized protein n=1 Tax=Melampsora larici-populina (strain 98AG31 / pathotype 3-4-7) TaxID=747676 RepID=F4RY20_MELLP|nr:uncharacterized protein MELLADRAFT_66143 [Melampsora larici-populina 98AG31]EGG02720.1 hypothetical protein MELLADRAFT_66143 [Melampsora larici-populina 98AG31]
MVTQTAKYKAELILAQLTLERLVQVDETHTKQYFEVQWNRQQEMQLRAISVRVKEKRERLKVMLQLEENMIEARQKMAELDAIHAPIRTQQQRDDLLNLPTSLANLEIKIQDLAEELGNTQLVNARRGDGLYALFICTLDSGIDIVCYGCLDAQIKAVLAVQVALAMLYEAKFGVLQQEADAEMRTGAKQQPRNAELRAKKQGLLRKKTATYLRHAAKYNNRFQPAQRLLEPTFEEVRQLMLWGLDYQARVIGAKPNAAESNNRLVEWESLYSGLAKRTCWLWKRWDHHGVVEVLHSTSQFVEGSDELDVNLRQQWADMVVHTRAQWEVILGAGIYVVEEENNVEDFDEEDFDEYY